MPMRRADYPRDWPAISACIRERAGGRCAWCGARHGRPHPVTGSIVVLTVAHLGAPTAEDRAAGRCWGDKHDEHDVREENLCALCQRCHLSFDADDHARHAATTRRRKRVASGQREFADGTGTLLGSARNRAS